MKKFLLLVLNMAAAVSLFTFSTRASAQIGSLSNDLVFTPLAPCRIMDTRNPGGISGLILAGTTRAFNGNGGGTNYTSQGGLLATCGLPLTIDVAAIVLNVTVTQPAAAGYITVFPADAAQPLASSVNFTAGAVVANNATLKISQADANGQFKIFSITNVHVVADVVGYYSRPVATAIECNSVFSAATDLPAGAAIAIFTPQCSAGYTMMSGGCYRASGSTTGYTNAFGFAITGSTHPSNPLAFYCGMHNDHATEPSKVQAKALCCRIPGR